MSKSHSFESDQMFVLDHGSNSKHYNVLRQHTGICDTPPRDNYYFYCTMLIKKAMKIYN